MPGFRLNGAKVSGMIPPHGGGWFQRTLPRWLPPVEAGFRCFDAGGASPADAARKDRMFEMGDTTGSNFRMMFSSIRFA